MAAAVRVRTMVGGDADPVGRLHHRVWVATYGSALPADYFTASWPVDAAVRAWRDRLAAGTDDGLVRLVAEGRGGLVGFVVSGPAIAQGDVVPVRGHALWALYVDVPEHGTGAGQALLDAAVGAGPAQLWVYSGNARAIAFYRRNGFVPDGATYVDERFPQLDEVRMVR